MKTPLTTIFTCDNSGGEIGRFESDLLDYKVGQVVGIKAERRNDDNRPRIAPYTVASIENDYIDLLDNSVTRVIKVSRVIL